MKWVMMTAVVCALAGGCASRTQSAASTSGRSGVVIDIFRGLPAEELERYEGQTVTVRGFLAQGNFALALGPRRTIHHSDMWIALHARKNSAAGHDALKKIVAQVGLHNYMEATGTLRCHIRSRDGAWVREADRDVWPIEAHSNTPLFWIELTSFGTGQKQD